MEVGSVENKQTTETTPVSTPTAADIPEAFSSIMKKATGLSEGSQINEEELFAAIVEKKLTEKSAEAGAHFTSEKAQLMVSMARSDGAVSVEDVAKAALQSAEQAGLVTAEESKKIYSESFRAAQIDDNLTALYDGRGSAGDPTIAQAEFASAMAKTYMTLQQIENGELDPEAQSISGGTIADGKATEMSAKDGAEGFLWKPESESDGNLVVLLPTALKGFVEKLGIYNTNEANELSLLEEGRFTGDTQNGDRPHYRFNKPGEEYGDNLYAVATLTDGQQVKWSIANGSERID